MGTKRIIIGAIILTIGIIAWMKMWYGENGLLPTLSSTNMTKALSPMSDPNTTLSLMVVAVIVAIGSVILASGIRSSLSHD